MHHKYHSIALLALLVSLACNTGAQDLTCFEEGECSLSTNVAHWNAAGNQECLELCQSQATCQYFTYFEDEQDCLGFANCEVLSTNDCDDCYTGQRECDDLVCWTLGQCDGTLLDQISAGSTVECHQNCRNEPNCRWFTFDTQGSSCSLLGTCGFIDPRCDSCTSGQVQCTAKTDQTKVIVIGGYFYTDSGNYLQTIQTIDLANIDNTCMILPNYPTEISDSTATIFDGKLLSCGGEKSDDFSVQSCYAYDPSSSGWFSMSDMIYGRNNARSSIIGDEWLISGGGIAPNSTTEWWDGSSFRQGFDLPIGFEYHCQININSSHIFFADISHSGSSYILDLDQLNWIPIDPVPNLRYYPACGYAYGGRNGQVIVVAGDGTSDIFSLSSLSWISGPNIASNVGCLTAAQLQTTLLIMGGCYDGDYRNAYSDQIYKYDQYANAFVLQVQTLATEAGWAAAVAVQDEFVNC